jgi:hypothetical protein
MTIADLEPLVGRWAVGMGAPPADPQSGGAETVFDWLSGRELLIQRWQVPAPEAPDGIAVVAFEPDKDRFLQHYFDSRGVIRLYEMSFANRTWKLWRTKPDFSPLDFSQRFTGSFSDDGNTIAGRWESAADGKRWELDFELFYVRIA